MKTTIRQLSNRLLMTLLVAISALSTQAAGVEPGDSTRHNRPFDVGMFMGPQWKINLLLTVRQAKRVRITLKHGNHTVLYREYVRKSRVSYWRKFNFDDSESGTYEFEISDGRTTIVRRVEVVTMPTVESQRYITYGPQIGQ